MSAPNIDPPRLHGRSYRDLRDELMRRIPVHAPDWTDHNPGDPGVALLELFAWLVHDLEFQVDQVPQRSRAQFLDLLDLPRRPPHPARVTAVVDLARGGTDPVVLAHGPDTGRLVLAAGGVPFEAQGELVVLPAEARAYIKERSPLSGPEAAFLAEGVEDLRLLLRDHLNEGGRAPDLSRLETYRTRALEEPHQGEAPIALDLREAVDGHLWVALLAPAGAVKAKDPAARKQAVEALRAELSGKVVSLGVRVDESVCGPADPFCCDDLGCPEEARTVWFASSGCFACDDPRVDRLVYLRAPTESDGTGGFTRSGVVRVRLPQQLGVWNVRERFHEPDLEGVGDLPPALDDEALEERVLAWLRCVPADGAAPCVEWVAANAVELAQQVTAGTELLGTGSERPGQRLRLAQGSVVSGSLLLEVEEHSGQWVTWHEVPTLDVSRPTDRHYRLDALAGEVVFGDGIRGRLPGRAQRIRARSYVSGGGAQGNVGPGAISKVLSLPDSTSQGARRRLQVTNPFPASGGRDAESLGEAQRRIPHALRNRERAVAAEDFEALALQTPGTHVGRVEVLARHKAPEHVEGVPGVVTLVVVPAHDPRHPSEPVPDKAQLRKVCEWLGPRRLIGTELCLIAPEYVPVWISVALETDDCHGIQAVGRWVDLAIRQQFAPLPPYGPAGAGWPFGRDVRDRDAEVAASRVKGVRLVHDVILEGEEIDRFGERTERKGKLRLERWQLPVVRGVQVRVGEKAEPISRDCACPPELGAPGNIPIPVVREPC